MNQSLYITPSLRQLSELEIKERGLAKNNRQRAEITRQVDSLRARIPTAILAHHDRLKVRGKPSIAPVARGHCGACHLVVSRGRLADLRRNANALNICDHCGVFIYLVEEDQPGVPDHSVSKTANHQKPRQTARGVSRRATSSVRKPVSSH